MVNGSSWNQNHYKYVQLDVLFNPNKYVLQDFARSFVRTSESESWEFFQQTENFIPLQRYLTNLDLQTIGSLHMFMQVANFLLIGLLSIHSLMKMLFYFFDVFVSQTSITSTSNHV